MMDEYGRQQLDRANCRFRSAAAIRVAMYSRPVYVDLYGFEPIPDESVASRLVAKLTGVFARHWSAMVAAAVAGGSVAYAGGF